MRRMGRDRVDPGQLVLQPRDVHFDWSGLPLVWIPGEPVASHTFNVLHLLLPEMEPWFVTVFNRTLPLIRDEALREDVLGFIAQETIHAQAHQEVLDYFGEHGLDARPYVSQMEWLFRHLLGARAEQGSAQAHRELIEHVAMVAAIEHFTAFIGDWILHSPGLDVAGANPVMLDLLRWHGAEEVEHRNVAFDLLVHLDPRYSLRIRAMALAGPLLYFLWARGARFMVASDPGLDRRIKFTWPRYTAAARRGLLPPTWAAIKSGSLYLRRDYHPSQEFSTRLAAAYLGTSPAARDARR